jgi:hypothetical protein
MPTPPTPFVPAFDAAARLREADTAGTIDLAAIVVEMLAPAGGLSEWDSETIENVLSPTQAMCAAVGMPWIGSADDAEAHRFWGEIATQLDIYTDFDPDDADA